MALVKDPVRPADRAEVYRRDGGCIAPLLDQHVEPCRDQSGREVPRTFVKAFTLDHVPPEPGATRISTPRWMVTACWGHGVHNGPGGSVWVTANRDLERIWLWHWYDAPPVAIFVFGRIVGANEIEVARRYMEERKP
jgi:hypothetical protein